MVVDSTSQTFAYSCAQEVDRTSQMHRHKCVSDEMGQTYIGVVRMVDRSDQMYGNRCFRGRNGQI